MHKKNNIVFGHKEKSELVYHKYLSNRNSPSSIIIDKSYNILFIVGDAGKRISHNEGIFENNLLKIVSLEVASVIRKGIINVEKSNKDVLIKKVKTVSNGENSLVDIIIHKPKNYNELSDTYILEFTKERSLSEQIVEIDNPSLDEFYQQHIEDLELDLARVKSELQNVVEELETSNEELQSSNEELMASNEELQSTNEELQSVNEELYTVNTELQEKNKELLNLNSDITNLLDNSDIGTLFLDKNLTIRKFTPALIKHFDLKQEDHGRLISTFTSNFKDSIRSSILIDAQAVLNGHPKIEKEVVDLHGTYYLKRISPFIDHNNEIDGVVINFIDLTEFRKLKEDLKNAETNYTELFQNLNEGFIHCKIITNNKGEPIDWKYISVNNAFAEQTGEKSIDLIGKKASQVIPNLIYDSTIMLEIYGKTALTGEGQFIDSYSESLKKYYIIHVFSPKLGEFAATFADITDMKNNEIALGKSESQLVRTQEISHLGTWFFDVKTLEITWTKELYATFGLDSTLPPPAFAEHSKLFVPESWERLENAIDNAINHGTNYDLELKTIRKDNTNGWLWVFGEAVKDSTGKTMALQGAVQDITSRKEAEIELLNAKNKAESASSLKNYFLANMSHEIRTPINGVVGFAELLKDKYLTIEERNMYLDVIDTNSKQLLSLIDDIIDIAKIESNEFNIKSDDCNISKMISNLELNFNQLAKTKGKPEIIIKSIIPNEHEDLIISTDSTRLRQVLSNLLHNALKFSEDGTILFGFNFNNSEIKFFVKDEGIGIPEDLIDDIFDRFKQVNYDKSATYGGTGLGLAICKGIVELLGGEISVTSKLDVGSEFSFTIPFHKVETEEITSYKKPKKLTTLNGKTILIAEDEMLIQMYFKAILKDLDAHVLYANNGNLAVQMYKDNPDVDIVFMDIRMPELNGFEAMEHILRINPNAVIIAQSAYVMAEEKERCLEIGCKDFLTKPIQKDRFFNIIQTWVK